MFDSLDLSISSSTNLFIRKVLEELLISHDLIISLSVSFFFLFIFTSNRYRKYSRDVSQALWTIGTKNEDDESEDQEDDLDIHIDSNERNSRNNNNNSNSSINQQENNGNENQISIRKRKGRCSVEEIIQEAINNKLSSCLLILNLQISVNYMIVNAIVVFFEFF